MTNEDKKMIMELIDTIQTAMRTLRTVIEKYEESSVPAADVTVTASKTESDSTLREIDERYQRVSIHLQCNCMPV